MHRASREGVETASRNHLIATDGGLSKGGVAPRTAQAAMRHSTIDLTITAYNDPKLLDVAAAMEALPALPPDGDRIATSATGTEG